MYSFLLLTFLFLRKEDILKIAQTKVSFSFATFSFLKEK